MPHSPVPGRPVVEQWEQGEGESVDTQGRGANLAQKRLICEPPFSQLEVGSGKVVPPSLDGCKDQEE